MAKRPLVAFAACWLFGVSAASLWEGVGLALILAGAGLVLCGAGLAGKMPIPLALVCAIALMAAAGERWWVDAHAKANSALEEAGTGQKGDTVVLTGYVASAVSVDGDLASFRFAVSSADGEPVLIRVKLAAEKEQNIARYWERGDLAKVEGVMERPLDAGNFGIFDYRAYIERKGIKRQISVKGASSVIVQNDPVPWRYQPMRQVDRWRAFIGSRMQLLFSERDAGYMMGLVAGIQDEIDYEVYDVFSQLGLTHVLAISGLHVAVVVFSLLRMFALLRLTRETGMALTIGCLPVYMVLTGASPSAVRACLMAMIALALARRHRLKDGLHLLSASAVLMTAYDPLVVTEVSFQLSFVVTAGLLLFVPVVDGWLPIRRRSLRSALAVAVTAQAVSFPLSAYYFHSLHLLSLPANLLLVPFISFVIMPLGMAAVVLGSVWLPLGLAPARLATFGNEATFWVVTRLNEAEAMRTVWPQNRWQWVAVAYALMGLTAALGRRALEQRAAEGQTSIGQVLDRLGDTRPVLARGQAAVPSFSNQATGRRFYRMALLALSLLWAGWLAWGIRPVVFDRSAKVSFLDVGQGDSALIRTGKGKYVLVDAGGTVSFRKPGDEWRERRDPYEVGRKLLVPLLKQRGVRKLSALVLTHQDQDHIGGAEAILRNVPVDRILFNGTLRDSPAVRSLFELALAKGIPLYEVSAGQSWALDETAHVDVLYPADLPEIVFRNEQNERSVVLLLTVYGRTFLLPGDLGADGERAVAALNGPSSRPQRIDVLKTGHHGSKTSTTMEWLARWMPRETIISVGRNNVYGHPHPNVLSRLTTFGYTYFRTDRDGEIQYWIHPSGELERRTKR